MRLIRLVSVIGFMISTYLSYIKLEKLEPVCATGGCEVVLNSAWSSVLGIPVVVLGMIGYTIIFALSFGKSDAIRLALAAFAWTGLVFSLWLQYQAIGVLEHLCMWCLGSAICMLILAALTSYQLINTGDLQMDDDFDNVDE